MQPKIEKFRMTKTVVIKQNEHANLDSFPLRYGFQFEKNTDLEIHCDPSTLSPDKNPKYKNRYNVIAKFTNPTNNRTERGVFYLINNQNNKFYDNDKVITVIRYLDEAENEHHLSEVLKSLRISNEITPQDLIKFHPLYMTRQLSTHADLIRILAEKKSTKEILKIQSIADQAIQRYEGQITKLNDELITLRNINTEIQNELNEYKIHENKANSEGSTQTLVEAKILVDVHPNVMFGNSSCTQLVMGDGTKLHMKTSTFDKNLKITAKAKLLKGRKVRTSCWDPIKQPGKFSSKGYFRNLYALSDKDVY
jgi:hypothetical protein